MKQWIARQIESSGSIQSLLIAFRSLNKAKQTAVLVALFCIVIWLIANITVIPLYEDYKRSSLRLDRVKADYAMLVENAEKLTTLSSSQVEYIDRSSTDLRSLVNESFKSVKLAPEIMSREGSSLLRIGISSAPFEDVAKWLNMLAQQQVKINSLQIQAMSPGMVSISISLD